MLWLLVTIIAYFLNAVAMVIDKTLLSKTIKNPFVYTFYIAILGAVMVVFILPFVFSWPGVGNFWFSLVAGGVNAVGLFFMFYALKKEEASRVVPVIGGLVAVFTVLLAMPIVGEILSARQLLAVGIIIFGSFIISVEWDEDNIKGIKKTLWLSVVAAVFFALSAVLTKEVYNRIDFISGFVWTRLGMFAIAMLPMTLAKNRRDLRLNKRETGTKRQAKKTTGRFLFGQFCGGSSQVLVQYAIAIASVSLVQALQGVQYVFVFIMVLLLTKYAPLWLNEKITKNTIIQKIVAIIFIATGVYLLIV